MIQYFDAAKTEVVRNGVGDDVLNPSLTDRPRDRRLVYIGTLSQRFDEALVGSLMDFR